MVCGGSVWYRPKRSGGHHVERALSYVLGQAASHRSMVTRAKCWRQLRWGAKGKPRSEIRQEERKYWIRLSVQGILWGLLVTVQCQLLHKNLIRWPCRPVHPVCSRYHWLLTPRFGTLSLDSSLSSLSSSHSVSHIFVASCGDLSYLPFSTGAITSLADDHGSILLLTQSFALSSHVWTTTPSIKQYSSALWNKT
jgi:hypothetical protein